MGDPSSLRPPVLGVRHVGGGVASDISFFSAGSPSHSATNTDSPQPTHEGGTKKLQRPQNESLRGHELLAGICIFVSRAAPRSASAHRITVRVS